MPSRVAHCRVRLVCGRPLTSEEQRWRAWHVAAAHEELRFFDGCSHLLKVLCVLAGRPQRLIRGAPAGLGVAKERLNLNGHDLREDGSQDLRVRGVLEQRLAPGRLAGRHSRSLEGQRPHNISWMPADLEGHSVPFV